MQFLFWYSLPAVSGRETVTATVLSPSPAASVAQSATRRLPSSSTVLSTTPSTVNTSPLKRSVSDSDATEITVLKLIATLDWLSMLI